MKKEMICGVEMPKPFAAGYIAQTEYFHTDAVLRSIVAAAVAIKDAEIASITNSVGNAQLAAFIKKHGEPVPIVAERDALRAEVERLKAQRYTLTNEQIDTGRRAPWGINLDAFTAGVRFAEADHVITGDAK